MTLSNESENPDSISKDNGYRRRFHMSQTWSAERSLVAALLLSLAVNALQFLDARRADGIQPRRLSAAAVRENHDAIMRRAFFGASTEQRRGLWGANAATCSTADPSILDCASVACPEKFQPSPAVNTGASTMVPLLADTRFRLHGPRSMLELTQLLYGRTSIIGEPYLDFTNPFNRQPNLKYDWTQLTERTLEQAFALLPHGGRGVQLVVEVGSFVGKSSVLIGNFLRKRASPAPLLCIDTWLGDLGMLLGQIYPVEMGKHNGRSTLYDLWLLNMMEHNLTERVLPLVTPSLLGARTLEYLRLAVDVLYLDSAHEYRETFMELSAYWPVVKPGGLLLGDDLNWKAVAHDVILFSRTHNLTLNSFDNCHEALLKAGRGRTCVWYLRKPTDHLRDHRPERRPVLREWRSDLNQWCQSDGKDGVRCDQPRARRALIQS